MRSAALGVCLALLAMWCAPPRAAAADQAAGTPGSTATDLNNLGVVAGRAGQFELGADYLRRAVQADPQDAMIRKNLSGVLTEWASQLRQAGELARAETLLVEAVAHDTGNGRAYAILGDLAYFARSDFAQAIASWTRAHAALPAEERRALADRIAQAQRDQLIERSFVSRSTAHFDIRMPSGEDASVTTLGPRLEEAYAALRSALGEGPPRLTVIVYSEQDLRRTYNQRDWAVGFYDGRLRLLRGEIGSPSATAFVAHELAHAFLHHQYGNGLPIWVHEGFAQQQEGSRPRSEEEQQVEADLISGALWVPLKWLDRRFTHPSSREDVWRAYAQARLVVAALVARHGMGSFRAFLQALARGVPVEAAYEQAFAPAPWSRTDQPMGQ